MSATVEKAMAALSPFLKTAGAALKAQGQGLMLTAPTAAAAVGGVVEVDGKLPTVAAGAFVAPTATLLGPATVAEGASVWYGASVAGAAVGAGACVGDGAVVRGAVGEGALVGANAVVLGSLGARAVVECGATVEAGASVGADGRVGAGSLVAAGAAVGAGELWSGSPAELVRALTPAELAAAAAEAALAVDLGAKYALECAKSYEELIADDAADEDKAMRHPRYFQPLDGDDEYTSVGGQDTGIVPGRIMNNAISQNKRMGER